MLVGRLRAHRPRACCQLSPHLPRAKSRHCFPSQAARWPCPGLANKEQPQPKYSARPPLLTWRWVRHQEPIQEAPGQPVGVRDIKGHSPRSHEGSFPTPLWCVWGTVHAISPWNVLKCFFGILQPPHCALAIGKWWPELFKMNQQGHCLDEMATPAQTEGTISILQSSQRPAIAPEHAFTCRNTPFL